MTTTTTTVATKKKNENETRQQERTRTIAESVIQTNTCEINRNAIFIEWIDVYIHIYMKRMKCATSLLFEVFEKCVQLNECTHAPIACIEITLFIRIVNAKLCFSIFKNGTYACDSFHIQYSCSVRLFLLLLLVLSRLLFAWSFLTEWTHQ